MKPGATLFVLLLTLWLCAEPAQARLGENLDQCAARYGSIVKEEEGIIPSTTVYSFQKKHVNILVTTSQNVCIKITYSKVDGSPFSRDEIETLLQSNVGTSAWGVQEKDGTYSCLRNDYKAIALYNKGDKEFSVSDYNFREKETALLRAKRTGLEGF
ncbi:MAG: hypothetical protein ACAI35_11640 [Candidatus Methylacidiphilales bacterium]|nr:hypothetical protein [Candidatus Methylacidiphilales bacterium]